MASNGRTSSKLRKANEAPSSALEFLHVIRKRWLLVSVAFVACVALSLGYSKIASPAYQATAMLEFDPSAIRPLADKAETMRGARDFWDTHEYYETQIKIITSNKVLARVARDQALPSDAGFLGLTSPPQPPPTAEQVAEIMRGRLIVEPVKNTRLVYVRYEDRDPKRARRLCEAIVNRFLDQNLEKTVSATSDAVVWLNGQVDHYRSELQLSENALHEFKKVNELPSTSINDLATMVRLEMQEFDTALSRTRTRGQELSARYRELAGVRDDDPSQVPASELLSNQFLQALRGQLIEATREREALLAEGKGANHPLVRRADDRIQQLGAALTAEIKNIKGALKRDLAINAKQEGGEAGLFDAARKRAVELNLKEIEFRRLDRSRAENEKLYSLLLERMKEADLARMMNVNDVRVVDTAIEPHFPIRPRTSINVALGAVLGLLCGMGLALLRQRLDNTVKTPDDVEQKLGLSFLGLLPELEQSHNGRARRAGGKSAKNRGVRAGPRTAPELIAHSEPQGGLSEAARGIRTNLLLANPDRPYRTILVSSAAPSEGKTTVACSIAIALAQGGQRVCIVDCDLRRPRLHRIFDRAGDVGVTNMIAGDATLDDVAKPTEVSNLWCIPAGPIPPNPADLMHSERFRNVLEQISKRFDRVVIDSPPLVAVTDSAIISALVDGVVFVLRAFKTTLPLCRQGLRTLYDVDAPIAGVVLNAVNLNTHEYNYYHYYYYKREGYAAHPVAPQVESDVDQESAAPPH